ncbi:MAG: chemotaxis protein CheW [Acidimicrobiales bacterium]
MSEVDEVVEEFLVESYENLDRLDADLLALEQDPARNELVASIFRSVHTIKGTCGFLGYEKLESVTHVGESLLSRIRDGQLCLSPPIASTLLSLVDAVRLMLASIEANGTDGEGDWSELVARLEALQQADERADAPANGAELRESADPEIEVKAEASADGIGLGDAPAACETVSASTATRANAGGGGRGRVLAEDGLGADGPVGRPEVTLVAPGEARPDAFVLESTSKRVDDDRRVGEVPVDHAVTREAAGADAVEVQTEQRASVSDSSVRVDVGLLDDLMNLVSELVLARNQILQHDANRDSLSTGTFQRLNLITTELQEAVMKTRMQPIRNVWSKFPRVVRDLAMTCGKQVRVEMEGEHTELDKTIIEAIRDPLTHVIRNAVDHGIETPEERSAASKPGEGRIRLRAFHESGQVNIEVSDDGGGIDPERVRAKAVERGLVTEAQSRALGERELVSLIFSPGFSTADKVTNVSGRGVGMDVVKTNIEQIGGTVDIQSELGQGTTLRVKIPLTLAIIPALMVTCGGERYAIPQVNLVELVRVEADQAERAIEDIRGAPVYRLRGRLLPLIYLDETLGVPHDGPERRAVSIVVLQVDDRTFGLVVDDVNDTEEIVVKPLGAHVKGIAAFAGATIMGDGRVALILDVLGLARQGHVVTEQRGDHGTALDAAGDPEDSGATMNLLLVATGEHRRTLAIPLGEVARLEEFPSSALETAGRHAVVQYGSRILPVVDLSSIVEDGSRSLADRPRLNVVVHGSGTSSVGLVVDEVVDIIRERVEVQGASGGPAGLAGATIVRGGVADLVDIGAVIDAAGIRDLTEVADEVVA